MVYTSLVIGILSILLYINILIVTIMNLKNDSFSKSEEITSSKVRFYLLIIASLSWGYILYYIIK